MYKTDMVVLDVVDEILDDEFCNYNTTKIMFVIQMILAGRCHIINANVLRTIVDKLSVSDRQQIQMSIKDVLSLLDGHGCDVSNYYDDKNAYLTGRSEVEKILCYLDGLAASCIPKVRKNIPIPTPRKNPYGEMRYGSDNLKPSDYTYIITSTGKF